jgi:hypothetical protein
MTSILDIVPLALCVLSCILYVTPGVLPVASNNAIRFGRIATGLGFGLIAAALDNEPTWLMAVALSITAGAHLFMAAAIIRQSCK